MTDYTDAPYHAVDMPDGSNAGRCRQKAADYWAGVQPNGLRVTDGATLKECADNVRRWKIEHDAWQDTLARMATDY